MNPKPPPRRTPPSRHTHGRSEVKERPEILAALAGERTRLGQRLRALRKARDLSQEQAADRIGVHPVQLARMEHGVSNVTLATLVATALAYDVPLRDLFRDETPSTSEPGPIRNNDG